MSDLTRQLFTPGNGTDESYLVSYCEGCIHDPNPGTGATCDIWFTFDLEGKPRSEVTAKAGVWWEDIQCTEREEATP